MTNRGTLILVLSVALGAALFLLSVDLAARMETVQLERLQAVTGLVAVVAGFPAAIFALVNYASDVAERKRAELWRRRQYVEERISQFEAKPEVQAVMTMLDYWNRPVLLPGAKGPIQITNEILTSALSPKPVLVDDEPLIRDAFDKFFDAMDRLGVMWWDVGLVSLDDLLPYVRYWLKLLDSAPRDRTPEFGPVIRTYIHDFNFEALERLMRAAGVATFTQTDAMIVDQYLESLEETGQGTMAVGAKEDPSEHREA